MKLKSGLTAAVALSLAAISAVAIAKRSNEVEYVYLDSKGKAVGGKTYHCGGGISSWGTVTAKSVMYSSPCN